MRAVSYKIKDLSDRILGWLAFIALSPVFFLVAAFIRLDSAGPVFFRQVRIGKDGRPFVAYKFRTMVDKATSMGFGFNIEPNDSRITRVGNFLRETSLDELPQLFNIIKGEMSLVGPRPTQAYQVIAYNTFQRRRLLVKPGITGWAQINGRNTIPWEERFKLDVWYVDHWSLKLDFYILMITFKVWARREGLYAPDISHDFGNTEDEERAIEILSSQMKFSESSNQAFRPPYRKIKKPPHD
jgi:lipopolysaccharide/colanic/teichoic acid biosynthesis glycosyltransferase